MKMENFIFELSPLALAYFSWLLFRGNVDRIKAVFFAVAVHEASHLLALSFFHCRVSAMKLRMNGLCICYSGNDRPKEAFFFHMAGPVGGLLFFLLGKLSPCRLLPEWLFVSCRISFFLSLFNLLPAFPLDGGTAARIILESHLEHSKTERLLRSFGVWLSVLLIFTGLVCIMKNSGFGASLAGVWILCANISETAE